MTAKQHKKKQESQLGDSSEPNTNTNTNNTMTVTLELEGDTKKEDKKDSSFKYYLVLISTYVVYHD